MIKHAIFNTVVQWSVANLKLDTIPDKIRNMCIRITNFATYRVCCPSVNKL